MIYQMPHNDSVFAAISHLPDESQMTRFLARIATGLRNHGYVLPDRDAVFFGPMGEIMVDADRDPSEDWANFVMPDRTPGEQQAKTEQDQVESVITDLNLGTAKPAQIQKALAWLLKAEIARRSKSDEVL